MHFFLFQDLLFELNEDVANFGSAFVDGSGGLLL